MTINNPSPISDIGPNTQRRARTTQLKRVKGLKFAIPIIATLLTAATIGWTILSNENPELKATAQILGTISKNELLNPRFESIDGKNQPYTITATRAIRGESDDNLIILDNPSSDILMHNSRWMSAKAGEGAYNQDKQRLILRKNVSIFDDQGYALETEEMNIDLKEETILSTKPVFAKGPAGAITAAGLYNNNKTGILSFNGPATLVLKTSQNSAGLGDLK